MPDIAPADNRKHFHAGTPHPVKNNVQGVVRMDMWKVVRMGYRADGWNTLLNRSIKIRTRSHSRKPVSIKDRPQLSVIAVEQAQGFCRTHRCLQSYSRHSHRRVRTELRKVLSCCRARQMDPNLMSKRFIDGSPLQLIRDVEAD